MEKNGRKKNVAGKDSNQRPLLPQAVALLTTLPGLLIESVHCDGEFLEQVDVIYIPYMGHICLIYWTYMEGLRK